MPTASSTPRSRGLSFTACEARASIAISPPSPWLSAYSTLVPISPYTTPMAPSVSAASDDLELCTDRTRHTRVAGFRYFWERYCALAPDQAPGGHTLCCNAATHPWQSWADVAGSVPCLAGTRRGQFREEARSEEHKSELQSHVN